MSELLETRPRLPPRLLWLPWLVGAIGFLLWAWATGWPPYTLKVDLDQNRLNTALPALGEGVEFRQTFTPHRDGLQEVELVLVRYGETGEGESGRITVQLLNSSGDILAEQVWPIANIQHNDTRRFRFPPQPAGQLYTLSIRGSAGNTVSVWGYDQDVLAGGTFTAIGVDTPAQELRFTTRYRLTFTEATQFLVQTFWQHGRFFLLSLIFLFLPGLFLQQVMGLRTAWKGRSTTELHAPRITHHDLPTRLALALALSISFWSLLWLWWSWIGLHWRNWSLGLLLVVIGVVWVVSFRFQVSGFRFWGRGWPLAVGREPLAANSEQSAVNSEQSPVSSLQSPPSLFPITIHNWLLLFILLLGFAVRLLALRDQAFPPWVDSSRHALITAVMAEKGQFLPDYEPFLGVVRAPYHYGFHTIAASLMLMTGYEVQTLLLWLGPVLNGLVPLAVYAAALLFTRRRSVGIAAAFLVAIPFFFPAYYATWGRFTQLAGMLILPVLLGVTWQQLRVLSSRFQVSSFRVWPLRIRWSGVVIGILAAGLFLVHFRVFLLYIPFVLALLLFYLPPRLFRFRRLSTQHSALSTQSSVLINLLFSLAAATVLALILILPRLIRLVQDANLESAFSGGGPDSYNDFPLAYFQTGWELYFAYAGLLCLPVILLAWWRGRRWAHIPLHLALWVGTMFLLLSGRDLGLPETWLINTNSMVITLFVPVSLVLAVMGERVFRWLTRPHWVLQLLGYGIVGGWFAAATLFGIERQVNILNEQTILARPADVAGLEWVDANLPPEAVIAVNSWPWLGRTWAGSDGGAWLVPMTGRFTTTPPVDYVYNPLLNLQVREWNSQMEAIEDWSTDDAAAYLRSQGITHIFVGQKGGFLDPSELLRNPAFSLLYYQDGVFVLAVTDGAE